MKAIELPQSAGLARLQHGFKDDFLFKDSVAWASVTDGGTAVVISEVGGVMQLAVGGVTDNNETYLFQVNETFKILDGRPIWIEAQIKFTEANVDDSNIIFGILDGWAANTLLDNGAGVKASYSGAAFSKVDGGSTWIAQNNDAGTAKKTVLDVDGGLTNDAIPAGGGSIETLRIEIWPFTSTKADFSFWHNGVNVAKHKDQAYANATEMAVGFGVKNGGANEEKLDVVLSWGYQKR